MAQLAPLGRYTFLAAALIVPGCRSSRTPPSAVSEYAPAGRCRACHAQIAKSYHSVAMARSVYRPAEANVIEDYSTRNQFFHAPSNRHYRMLRRDRRFFQRRFQLDAQGKEMNAFEQEVTHIIGSG